MTATNKDKIYELLEQIKSLVKENENQDGSFRFDTLRAIVALDFAKTEIEKTISNRNSFIGLTIEKYCDTIHL